MKKIESLTKEQEADMLQFRAVCLAHGRSTEPANRITTESCITDFYRLLGKERPYFWWCDGPAVGSLVRTILRTNLLANLGTNLGANLEANLRANLRANLGANLEANLRDNLWANLGANLEANLRANLGANLEANLRANLRANLEANLGANLRANLLDNLRDNLEDNLRDNLRANLGWHFWGQHEISWPAFYQWPNNTLRQMYDSEKRGLLQRWMDLSQSCGWWHPHEGIVFVCERPSAQRTNERGQLHCDSGPAIQCRDGWEVYALNNVRMKPCQVMTPAERMTPEEVLSETNADVRRELIRKVGVERMLAKLPHRVLNKRGNYEVLSVDFPQLNDARYLRMLNPSIGCWHMEGIIRDCNTVEQALNWRNSGWLTDAEILT